VVQEIRDQGSGRPAFPTLSSMRRRGLIVRRERSQGRELPRSENPDLGSPFLCGILMRRKLGKQPTSAFQRSDSEKEFSFNPRSPSARDRGHPLTLVLPIFEIIDLAGTSGFDVYIICAHKS
jgi:hypothetical protein